MEPEGKDNHKMTSFIYGLYGHKNKTQVVAIDYRGSVGTGVKIDDIRTW